MFDDPLKDERKEIKDLIALETIREKPLELVRSQPLKIYRPIWLYVLIGFLAGLGAFAAFEFVILFVG